jgi:hypothetical protein
MGPESVLVRNDPRARTLLGTCLGITCGFFILEMVVYFFIQERLPEGHVLRHILEDRYRFFSRGNLLTYLAFGLLLHAGIAGLMSAALQRTWLRNRRLALSAVLLIFVAFEGALVALSMGKI